MIAKGSKSGLSYKVESSWGTAATGNYQALSFVSESLAEARNKFQSNEIRSDRTVPAIRIGNKMPGGSITTDFQIDRFGIFHEHLLMSTTVTTMRLAPSALTTASYIRGDIVKSNGKAYLVTVGGTVGTVGGGLTHTSGTAEIDDVVFEYIIASDVASVTVTDAGTGYATNPTISFTGGGGSGATATATLKALSATVAAGGTGYATTQVLSLVGGTSTTTATFTVATVSTTAVATVTVAAAGAYTVLPSNAVATTVAPAGGTGATLTVTWGVGTVTVSAGGSGYTSAPTVVFSSGAAAGTAVLQHSVWSHVMIAGTTSSTGISMEKSIIGSDEDKYVQFVGGKVNTLEVSVAQEGIVQTTWGLVFKSSNDNASTQAGTAVTAISEDPVSGFESVISLDNNATIAPRPFSGGSFRISNDYDEGVFCIGQDTRREIPERTRQCSGSVTVYWEDATEYDLFKAETSSNVNISFNRNGEYISYNFPEMKFTGNATPSIGSSGTLSSTLEMTMFKQTGSYDCKVTIISLSSTLR